jgi:anaerobic magnesium-protoporphyrin IX monomethyl ester cyclase
MNKNIMLVFPSFLSNAFGSKWRKNSSIVYPVGLFYIAAALERQGYSVRVIDFNVDKYEREEFDEIVRSSDMVGISVYTRSYRNAQGLCSYIRKVNPGALIIAGGPHINLMRELFPGTDLILVGEGEEVIGEVVTALFNGDYERLQGFPGLIFRKNGEIVNTGTFLQVSNLDTDIYPARQLIDRSKYGELIDINVTDRIDSVVTSRGCPYSCTFCIRKCVFSYRVRSPEHVVDEIEQLSKSGTQILVFNEDNFLVDRERAIKIMDGIVERRIKVRILIQARVDVVDDELYSALRRGGVFLILYGIESANQDILDFYDKRTTVEQAERAIRTAKRYGIFTYGFFILGAPMEREEHIRRSIQFVLENPLDFIALNILDYQYGSRLWKQAHKEGLVRDNQLIVTTNSRFGSLDTATLEEFSKEMYRAFYLRPSLFARIFAKSLRARNFILLKFTFKLLMKILFNFRVFSFISHDNPETIECEKSHITDAEEMC